MSLSDLAEPPLSPDTSSSSRSSLSLTIPTSLLILPSSAAIIGLSIGIVRGGNKARLRFLAENAHRQPKTIQGWYFYTKTRNYRVFFGAAKVGARYALGLGGATAFYVLIDESVGWAREYLFGPYGEIGLGKSIPRSPLSGANEREPFKRVGWRKGQVKCEDGAIAGTLMGALVGIAYRLPRPLRIRALIMGAVLGGTTSALQIAQAHIGKLRDEQQEHQIVTEETKLSSSQHHMSNVGPTPTSGGAATALMTEETAPLLDQGTPLAADHIPLDDDGSRNEGQSWWARTRQALGV